MTKRTNEDGAMLIIVLFFATTIALIVVSLATLAFTSTKTAKVYTDRGKLVNALDSGVQAAIENARLHDTAPACPDDPSDDVKLPDVNGFGVAVTCAGTAGQHAVLTFEATAVCPAPPADQPSVGITTIADFSTIGSGSDPPRIARVASRKLNTNACTS
ncbi:MAG TPA: hypothetical protein VHZ31_06120 [Solirubrobacteraceae bacterium]|jgi:Tfp pilus assembly protein PilX|nr:hypothetical protein [Solirubrobacteraceae bacterium]